MKYHFRLMGNGLKHAWQKDCWRRAVAVHHARQVARECARDEHYRGVVIEVLDCEGNKIDVVPVPNQSGSDRTAARGLGFARLHAAETAR
jgi:hypothetical protein